MKVQGLLCRFSQATRKVRDDYYWLRIFTPVVEGYMWHWCVSGLGSVTNKFPARTLNSPSTIWVNTVSYILFSRTNIRKFSPTIIRQYFYFVINCVSVILFSLWRNNYLTTMIWGNSTVESSNTLITYTRIGSPVKTCKWEPSFFLAWWWRF